MRVNFTQRAEGEIRFAYHWYSAFRKKLGDEFLSNLHETVQKIVQFPKSYRFVSKYSRAAKIRKYPYLVIYKEKGDSITILSIFHTSRSTKNLST